MEKRLSKISISSAGGTASPGSKTYKLSLPSSWLAQMGIDENSRQMELSFDGQSITATPYLSFDEFTRNKLALNHSLYSIRYFDNDTLCTVIHADFTDKTLRICNYTNELVKTAFGKNEFPSWEDLSMFLEERCISHNREGLREYLDVLGLDEYSPLDIIKKTEGRMAEDNQWIALEELR